MTMPPVSPEPIARDPIQTDRPVSCLLVDDLEENLLALSALLRRDDVELLTARSGGEALELLLEHDVALAIIDVQMPDMDGFELAELMRGTERTRHVPLIFVTAGARDEHRLFKGYDSGAVDFLYKPIEPRVLRNKAEVFFELHRQKRRLGEELRERNETLRLNEMLAAALGHDLRSPLGAILTGGHLLQHYTDDPVIRETAGRIVSSGKRMNRMIEDMLDLARARLAGGIPITRAPADLGSLVQRVTQEQRSAYPNRQIEISHEGDLTGQWDTDRLAQVASNLIGNALQHGDDREPVDVRLEGAHPQRVVLSVGNAGAIPPEDLARLFHPFRGRSRRGGGLGLGLYITQQIVKAHQGRIEVQSDGGRTRFQVTVPRGRL